MKNYAVSVRARLKNQMRETKEPLAFLELQYVQERFLYRLSQSQYKEQFVLKGGTLFYVWADLKYRATKDLDFMFYGKVDGDELLSQIKEICQLPYPEDGIGFDWDSFEHEEIREGHDYDGLRIQFTARIVTSVVSMKLDICTGDVITPEPVEYAYPRLLPDNLSPRLKMYPKETVIAEKVHAMVSLDLTNSRMKDFFDVFILISDFADEIEKNTLAEAIRITFSHRKTSIPTGQLRVWTAYFYEDRNKLLQWNAFIRRNKIAGNSSLREVCERINHYLQPVLSTLNGE